MFAKYTIIGHIGSLKRVGKTLKISIGSTSNFKDKDGNWVNNTDWNSVTIINAEQQDRILDKYNVGDLIYTEGRIKKVTYTSHGEEVHETSLLPIAFKLLKKKTENVDVNKDEIIDDDCEGIPY